MNKFAVENEFTDDLVSVLIPTYNRAKLLKEAVQSVIDQSYRPIECIIVDDGSNDNSKEIINSFIEKNIENFKIKYFLQKNAGAQVARNLGTKYCTGEFIQYLDSDDLLNSEKIKHQVRILKSNPDIDGTYGDFRKGSLENNKLIRAYQKDDLLTQFLTEFCAPNFSLLLRRDYVENIGDWDIKLKRFQDIDFHLRGFILGGKYKYVSFETGLWRTHGEERISERADLNDIFEYFGKWESILVRKNLFTQNIKNYFANFYFFTAVNNNLNSKSEKLKALKLAAVLDPHIPFISTPKMKYLRRIFGLKNSLKMWLSRSEKITSKEI